MLICSHTVVVVVVSARTIGAMSRCPFYRRSVTYTFADAGAFDRRTANDTRMASAMIVPPIAFMMMPSSVHSEYLELQFGNVSRRVVTIGYNSHKFACKYRSLNTHLNVNRAFSVRPVTQVAQASMNVTKPKLA